MGEPVVETTLGKLSGLVANGVTQFRGVRYGAPTEGKRRYRAPESPAAWSGVQSAQDFPPGAPQDLAFLPRPDAAHGLAYLPPPDVFNRPGFSLSEDCLFVNIWTPAIRPEALRPVMVWLHGGGFNVGSASSPISDGSALARDRDVVVVAVQHRLGALGYLRLDSVSGGRIEGSANLGTQDQVLALRWVHDNIEAFGGDPRNVTIFGNSGGGWKVSVLLGTPPAEGLFQHAIIQSGPGVRIAEADEADVVAGRLLHELRLEDKTVEGICDLPFEQIVQAQIRVQRSSPPNPIMNHLRGFIPSIEQGTTPRHPFDPDAAPTSRNVDVMVGWNRTEMTLFSTVDDLNADEARLESRVEALAGEDASELLALYRVRLAGESPARLLAAIHSDITIVPFVHRIAERHSTATGHTYAYRLDWETPVLDGKLMTPHGLEVPFIFGTYEGDDLTGNGDPTLSANMMGAWSSFATSGDPNPPGSSLPEWAPFSHDRSIMLLNTPSELRSDPYAGVIELLGRIADRWSPRT